MILYKDCKDQVQYSVINVAFGLMDQKFDSRALLKFCLKGNKHFFECYDTTKTKPIASFQNIKYETPLDQIICLKANDAFFRFRVANDTCIFAIICTVCRVFVFHKSNKMYIL